MARDDPKDSGASRRWPWVVGVCVGAFLSNMIGAVVAATYITDAIQREWLHAYGVSHTNREQQSRRSIDVLLALEMKSWAERRDYDSMLQYSCLLLQFSLRDFNPEVWEDAPRRKEEDERYVRAHAALSELTQAGHCATNTEAAAAKSDTG